MSLTIAAQGLFNWLLLDMEHTPVDLHAASTILAAIGDVSGGRCTLDRAATLPKDAAPLRIAIHVRGDPQRFATRLRELAQAVDPALLVDDPVALPRVKDADVSFAAFLYYLLAGFASVALVLSLAGVYSVTAFAVAKRTREIGVRVALGAMPRQIVATTFKRPFIQIALGIGVGALVLSTLVISELERPSARELAPVGIVVALIGVCCMVACIIPVQRALRIQPTDALKDEG